jgi:hypothetical protein
VPYTKGALLLTRLEQVVGRERWDAFLRGCSTVTRSAASPRPTSSRPRGPARTRGGSVDVARWTRAGPPADAPRPKTRSLAAVDAELRVLRARHAPRELATHGCTTQQWLRFLRGLPGRRRRRR